jgi:hypothetical protein
MIDFGDTVTRIEPTIDEIARVAYARDLLRGVHDERGGGPVRRLLRPAHFVPETNASHELLAEMQVGHFNLAIVVDDHGAIAGLVTLEDLMEDSSGRSPTSPTSRNPSSGPTATARAGQRAHPDRRAQGPARHRPRRRRPGHRRWSAVRCTGTSRAPAGPRPVAVTRCGPNACGTHA